jgi:DNA-binding CsgD family transcriptional regulator
MVVATAGMDSVKPASRVSNEAATEPPRGLWLREAVGTRRGADTAAVSGLTGIVRRVERRLESTRRSIDQAHDELEHLRRGLEALARAAPKTVPRSENSLATLTRQEKRIALLASRGLSNAEVAADINIAAETVRGHMKGVFRKLGIHSRWELAYVLIPGVSTLSDSNHSSDVSTSDRAGHGHGSRDRNASSDTRNGIQKGTPDDATDT